MTQTRTYTVYQFSELSEEARRHALRKYWDFNVDQDTWHDSVISEWQDEKLPRLGYDQAVIGYRGFNSQGDGAHFIASVNVLTWIKAHGRSRTYRPIMKAIRSGQLRVTINIVRGGLSNFYQHENTTAINAESDWQGNGLPVKVYDDLVSILADDILAEARKTMREIYRALEKEYNDLTTEQAVIDQFTEGEYWFTEAGDLATHQEPD